LTIRPRPSLSTLGRFGLLLALAAALPVPAQQTPPDPTAWLRSGPMLGAGALEETTVWLQTVDPRRVQVRFWERDRPESARLTDEVRTTAEGDLIARLRLAGLRFGARYDYEVYLDGRRVALPFTATFQSPPMWRHRTAPPDLRIAVGSCAYVNDPPYDRPDPPYGGDYQIFRAIAEQRPDVMLWLGDNVYLREGDWTSEAGIRRRYAHTRALPELQPLLASAFQLAIWDDHDFGSNDADRTYPLRETSLQVFRDYWANPSYGTLETPGVFTRVEWGDIELFLLDDRFHRSANRLPDADPAKRMFGAAQLRWLEEALAGSGATFKIVVNGNQMWNPITNYEAFGHFAAEQAELLAFLEQMKIPGVVFLTGDRHATELLRRDVPGLYPLYEFTSSPLTSGASRNEKEKDNPARVPGTWVTERNFGLLEVTGQPKARVLTLRTLDAQGKELWRHAIREDELRAP
jgi:alkaline phosphatase D